MPRFFTSVGEFLLSTLTLFPLYLPLAVYLIFGRELKARNRILAIIFAIAYYVLMLYEIVYESNLKLNDQNFGGHSGNVIAHDSDAASYIFLIMLAAIVIGAVIGIVGKVRKKTIDTFLLFVISGGAVGVVSIGCYVTAAVSYGVEPFGLFIYTLPRLCIVTMLFSCCFNLGLTELQKNIRRDLPYALLWGYCLISSILPFVAYGDTSAAINGAYKRGIIILLSVVLYICLRKGLITKGWEQVCRVCRNLSSWTRRKMRDLSHKRR